MRSTRCLPPFNPFGAVWLIPHTVRTQKLTRNLDAQLEDFAELPCIGIDGKSNPRRLANAAEFYDNSAVRRLGCLPERLGHGKQAFALRLLQKRSH